jgi:mRNA interferase RelE/StbE
MNVEFRSSFVRDLKRVRDKELTARVKEVILRIEATENLGQLDNLRRLRGGGDYYRVRLGDYRIGILLKDETVIFVRFMHRRDIYRYFP